MPAQRSEIEGALQRKGFVLSESDHRYLRLHVQGKKTAIVTKTSHGTKYKTLSDQLVSLMAKQVKLTKKQFLALVECSMSGEQYLEALRAQQIEP